MIFILEKILKELTRFCKFSNKRKKITKRKTNCFKVYFFHTQRILYVSSNFKFNYATYNLTFETIRKGKITNKFHVFLVFYYAIYFFSSFSTVKISYFIFTQYCRFVALLRKAMSNAKIRTHFTLQT